MLNFDLSELSHLIQDSTLTLELRLALILINHGYTPATLTALTDVPKCDWILFEKPFIKVFKKRHPGAPFSNITAPQLAHQLAPFIKSEPSS